MGRVARATEAQIRAAAERWLSDGVYTLTVEPFPDYAVAPSGVDRSKLPAVGTPPKAAFPTLERATLSNGLKVVLAERRAIPVVHFDLLLDAGFAADQFAQPGTASLAMSMLDEGTTTRTALQISDRLADLGASIGGGSRLDVSSVSLDALRERLDPALELYADVVLHPAFRQSDLERLRKQRLVQIQREKADPLGMALRVFPRVVFGEGHAYANPWSGSGTEASARKITRADLVKFHDTWFKPNHATIVVVGATTMAEIRPRLERLFAGWRPGEVPAKNIAQVAPSPKPEVYLLDRPGAEQTTLIAGNVAPPKSNPDEPAIETMSAVLGSDFGSRLNMNLREDKHWSYGAYSFIRDARGPRPFLALAPVQTDRTKEAIVELRKELAGIVRERPIQPDELERAKASLTLTLPGSWETIGAVAGSIGEIIAYGLDDRYFDTYADRVRAQTAATVTQAAGRTVLPDRLIWVIVGDRAKIEPAVRELGLGELHFVDADGNAVPTS
jgi:zinc protease